MEEVWSLFEVENFWLRRRWLARVQGMSGQAEGVAARGVGWLLWLREVGTFGRGNPGLDQGARKLFYAQW